MNQAKAQVCPFIYNRFLYRIAHVTASHSTGKGEHGKHDTGGVVYKSQELNQAQLQPSAFASKKKEQRGMGRNDAFALKVLRGGFGKF